MKRNADEGRYAVGDGAADIVTAAGGSSFTDIDAAVDESVERAVFFTNEECPYFPCHDDVDPGEFNCLFCYCPLYALGEGCPGAYAYIEGPHGPVKDCSGCGLPHRGTTGNRLVDVYWTDIAASAAFNCAAANRIAASRTAIGCVAVDNADSDRTVSNRTAADRTATDEGTFHGRYTAPLP